MKHVLALRFQAKGPSRVGAHMESAHSILAGLDPSDEIASALAPEAPDLRHPRPAGTA